jgi:uncharacterized protein (TIGR00369 family)
MENTSHHTSPSGSYPPKEHMLRDLGVSWEFQGKDRSTVWAPVVPEICGDQGAVPAGVIATLVDVLGGVLSIRAVYPDWIATADLSLYTTGQATGGRIAATGSVIRAGRTAVVIDVGICEERGSSFRQTTSIGSAMMTFSRLPRREDTPEVAINENSTGAFHLAPESPGLTQAYLERIGLRVVEEAAGIVEVRMSEYIRNSFHCLQGGILALLGDAAGQYAARHATGMSAVTSDLEIHYLSLGKVGPFRTKAAVIRTTEETALSRVEVIDCGADNRLITVIMNTAMLHNTERRGP